MKSFICLLVVGLVGCEAPFEDRAATADSSNAGAPDDMGTGGNAGKLGIGKAGSPNVAGSDSGIAGSDVSMAGSPDMGTSGTDTGVSGSGGMGQAGKGSAGSGMGGMGIAGGSSAGSGMGGAESAGTGNGTGGSVGGGNASGGTGGSVFTGDECAPSGRVGTWSGPVWDWANADANDPSTGKTSACVSQFNRIGQSVLTLEAPTNCVWSKDPNDVGATGPWSNCVFSDTLVCTPVEGGSAFTAQVMTRVTNGRLIGSLTYSAATAGGCAVLQGHSTTGGLNFSATRN